MLNENLLKAKIYEKGFKMQDVAKKLKLSKSYFATKANGKNNFTTKEIVIIKMFLNLTDEETTKIFLN